MTDKEVLQMVVDYYSLDADAFENKYYMQVPPPRLVGKTIVPGYVSLAEKACGREGATLVQR